MNLLIKQAILATKYDFSKAKNSGFIKPGHRINNGYNGGLKIKIFILSLRGNLKIKTYV